MCGLDKVVLLYIILISVTKVNAYFNDFLNPIKDTEEVWSQRRTARDASEENDNIYICEEPADAVPPESNRTCNFRNANYHEQIYKWVAGRGCLVYTPEFLYVDGVNTLNLNTACIYGNLWAPCLEILKEDGTYGCYPFDPGLEEVVTAVRNAIIPAAHGRWERCFEEAANCCTEYMAPYTSRNWYNAENLDEDEEIQVKGDCNPTFDGWTCWPSTSGGTTAVEVCSQFAYSNQGPSCNHYSSKQCFEDGTWAIQTDYSTCSITSRLLRRYRFYIAMLATSIASCLPAVIIFLVYKRLRVTRVALHRNLLIAIIIRNILVIISRSEVYIDELTNAGETVMSAHAVGCKVLAILERIAGNAVFVCMLVEGIYLHRMIVTTFKRKLKVKWLYAGAAVIAIVPVIAWSIVMGLLDDHSCWLVYTVPHIQWILDAPRLAVLIVNTGLFIDVLRVLLTKLRNSENAQQLSTTKATLFLMPIFGTQFLLTAFRPSTTNCTGEQIYYYVTYTVEGLQGFIVAMLYCYVNKEVRMLIKATYQKTEIAVVSHVRGNAYGRPSVAPTSRRMTFSTNLPSHDDEIEENSIETPNLHVAEIISIPATERIAEILEPAYETVQFGHVNDDYNSSLDGYPAMRHGNSYTNASSISYDNEDWIRSATSPESSDYISYQYGSDKQPDANKAIETNELEDLGGKNSPDTDDESANDQEDRYEPMDNSYRFDDSLNDEDRQIIDQFFQSIDENKDEVALNPELLSPNRQNEDKIMFID